MVDIPENFAQDCDVIEAFMCLKEMDKSDGFLWSGNIQHNA